MSINIQTNIPNFVKKAGTHGFAGGAGAVPSFTSINRDVIQSNADRLDVPNFNKTPSNINFRGLLSNFSTPVKSYKNLEKFFEDTVGVDISSKLREIKDVFPDSIKVENGNLLFKEKGFLESFLESLIFPVTKMPFMIADFILKILMKIPLLKGSNTLNKMYNSSALLEKRNAERLSEQYNSVKGLYHSLESIASESNPEKKIDKLFKQTLRRFDANIGNYNTVHERSLNRIVSGIIPAMIFLGNDAHNVYIDTKNDIAGAKKEAQVRRNQELMRVAVTAYLQLITLGAVSKYANKSAFVTIACILAPVLVSESFSRYFQDKPLTFMSKEETKEFNKKVEQKNRTKTDSVQHKHKNRFSTLLKGVDENLYNDFAVNKPTHNAEDKKSHKSGIKDTLRNLGIMFVGMATAGFALREVGSRNKVIGSALSFLADFDKNMIKRYSQKPYEISKSALDNILKTMRDSGYDNLAKEYNHKFQKLAKVNLCGNYEIGAVDTPNTKWLRATVTPMQFLINLTRVPYNIVNDSAKLVGSFFMKEVAKTKEELDEAEKKELTKLLTTSVVKMDMDIREFISKKGKTSLSKDDLRHYFEDKILGAFNSDTISQQPNNILSKTVSFWSRVLTSYFLVVDDYGVVMRATNGEDEDEAWVKAKSRVVQRGSHLFMSQMLIDLFNKTFAKAYLGSLTGMSLVTMTSSYVMEHLARWSIGMPTEPCTREELDNYRRSHESVQGFRGSYFRFWSKLSGRKLMSEMDSESA